MARRGRKPTGTNLLEHLQGSERAKTRLKGILETLSAERTIPDVCDEMGIGESMFHRVRSEVLQAALDRLEPRPLGRPSSTRHPQAGTRQAGTPTRPGHPAGIHLWGGGSRINPLGHLACACRHVKVENADLREDHSLEKKG